ncbi:MAG TPA: hypothetical protein VIF09_04585 [Polyangiaceae bacterium]
MKTDASDATRDKAASPGVIAALSRVISASSSVKAEITVVAFHIVPFEAAITRAKAARSTETSAFTAEKSALSDEEAEITRDEAEGRGEKAEIVDEEAEIAGEEAEITDEDAEITVEPAEVAREEVQSTRNEVHFPENEEANMSVTNAIKRSIATFKTTGPVQALIASANEVVTRMTGNSAFPTPAPPLATVAAAIAELQSAQTGAAARTKGAVTVRDDKRAALVTLLMQLKGYVQNQADASLENGAALIESAGITVRKTAVRKPRTFTALAGPTSGSVKLVAASAARRASYEWQYSTDGGKTWIFAPGTLQAKTTITALTPGASVQFKYRPVLKAGDGDWSQAVTIIVK